MPKMKTKRSAAKRFRLTARGKVRCKHAFLRHNLSSQTKKAKKRLMKSGTLAPCDAKVVKKLLPYG